MKFLYISVPCAMAGQVHKFRTVRWGNGHARRNAEELFALARGPEGAVHGDARDKFCTASAGTRPSVGKIGRLKVLDLSILNQAKWRPVTATFHWAW